MSTVVHIRGLSCKLETVQADVSTQVSEYRAGDQQTANPDYIQVQNALAVANQHFNQANYNYQLNPNWGTGFARLQAMCPKSSWMSVAEHEPTWSRTAMSVHVRG